MMGRNLFNFGFQQEAATQPKREKAPPLAAGEPKTHISLR
jgi:hypothetical protein